MTGGEATQNFEQNYRCAMKGLSSTPVEGFNSAEESVMRFLFAPPKKIGR